jgi:hypothetical protein
MFSRPSRRRMSAKTSASGKGVSTPRPRGRRLVVVTSGGAEFDPPPLPPLNNARIPADPGDGVRGSFSSPDQRFPSSINHNLERPASWAGCGDRSGWKTSTHRHPAREDVCPDNSHYAATSYATTHRRFAPAGWLPTGANRGFRLGRVVRAYLEDPKRCPDPSACSRSGRSRCGWMVRGYRSPTRSGRRCRWRRRWSPSI